MATKLYCDGCNKEHTPETPILDYQIKVDVDCEDFDAKRAADFLNSKNEFALEYRRADLCQECVKKLQPACKAFVEGWKSVIEYRRYWHFPSLLNAQTALHEINLLLSDQDLNNQQIIDLVKEKLADKDKVA